MTYDIVSERTGPSVRVTAPADVYKLVERYKSKKQEFFLLITLQSDNLPIRVRVVTIGLLDRTLVHPREIFSAALQDRAKCVILAHTHPSGNLSPSREDSDATARLCRAGELLGIPVVDHVIVGRRNPSYFSFREQGLLPSSSHY
ncbi:MAG: JAB domain-containing protein [Spirochaetales bacterium]